MNDPDNVVDPVVLAERRARRAELAEEELRELLREAELGAATLKGRLAAVEGELATARTQRDALAADLERREKELIASGRREHTEQALRSEAQTRAAHAETGSRRELEELRVRLVAAEQRAALLSEVEAEVAERLERARAAEDELGGLRSELQSRQSEIAALRHELESVARAGSAPPVSADPQLAARIAAERTAFAAQIAAVEHALAGLRPQLAVAAAALSDRLAAEQAARAEAERALADERERVGELERELAGATSRQAAVLEVVAELQTAIDALREQVAGDLDARVAELAGTADALREDLGAEQRLHSAARDELERLRAEREAALAERDDARAGFEAVREELDDARAGLEAVREERDDARAGLEAARAERDEARARLAAAEGELARDREQHGAARVEHEAAVAEHQAALAEREAALAEREAAVAEHQAARSEHERALDEHAAALAGQERVRADHEAALAEHEAVRQELERRKADHIALQAELAREQAQHGAAQSELGREQELRAAGEAKLAAERERLEATIAELEALRAPPPTVDIEDLTRAAERLREQAPPPAEADEPPSQAPPPPAVEPAVRRDELARVLAAQQAAAASAAAPDPYAHLPEFPVKAVVPFAAGDGSWLREAIRHVGRSDAALGAEVLLALAPVQAHAVRRPVAYQLTVNDAATWRVELGDDGAAIEPGASEAKVAFRLSGTPGELSALFAGGGRRKLKGHIEGSRMALWRVTRARREAPTLAQAVAAGGDFSLQAVLALLAAAAPEGGRSVVAFDDADSPITAVATRRGAVVLRSGIEQPQATLHAPEQDLVALLVGLAPAAPVRVSGDVELAAAFVTRLHRAQGLV